MPSRCEQELCPNWVGHGCSCEVLDIPRDGWDWPEWVPAKVREQIEEFYVYHGGPAGWLRAAERNGAPEFGSVVTLGDGFGSKPKAATGRFVFAWNNIARLVMADGSFRYTSFPYYERADA
jgi:hypothetical protein